MRNKQDLLIEIGTEELPPTSLKQLATAFNKEINHLLTENGLLFSESNWYATPRRLAVIIEQLQTSQMDESRQHRGPKLSTAFDEAGKATPAAEGFARSCGVTIDALEKIETDKDAWLAFNTVVNGQETRTLIPDIIETTLNRLPIPKRMRWGDKPFEFVRPVKWIVLLFGSETIHCQIMGVKSGVQSYGHRFHHPKAINIDTPSDYLAVLKKKGKVIADYHERRCLILNQVNSLAKKRQGKAIISEELLDEVTALTEWPVSFVGEFNADFLRLPREVLIASMQDHQKYFPVVDEKETLLPCFISVANINSTNPALIKQGNERVIQPRLNDAAFFLERDLNHGLRNHFESLKRVVYQKQLGTLYEKSQRLIKLVTVIANVTGSDVNMAKRAAMLCLCDLLTEMVHEFPALQGTMGRYYAEATGEDSKVAIALGEYYQPRFAGDSLPQSAIGQCLSISERIDSIVGIFAIGKVPTGDKDPFSLRRAAIGLLRIIIECELELDLKELIASAASNYPENINATSFSNAIFNFIMERLRHYYLDNGVSADTFESVLAIKPKKPLDFHHRLMAITEFRKLAAAKSLIAANKRIGNILKITLPDSLENFQKKLDLLTEVPKITLPDSLENFQKKLGLLTEATKITLPNPLENLQKKLNLLTEATKITLPDPLENLQKKLNLLTEATKITLPDPLPDPLVSFRKELASLLTEGTEIMLAKSLKNCQERIEPLLNNHDYQSVLTILADLRQPVDDFFDNVMVMCDDDAVKMNRLSLLKNLNSLFLEIADISKLQG